MHRGYPAVRRLEVRLDAEDVVRVSAVRPVPAVTCVPVSWAGGCEAHAATPRPHALSGHTDWRFEGEGVIPDQCSGSVSALPCVAGNGGVWSSRGKAQGRPSHPGGTGKEKAGRVKNV